jgi:hypothetical protein
MDSDVGVASRDIHAESSKYVRGERLPLEEEELPGQESDPNRPVQNRSDVLPAPLSLYVLLSALAPGRSQGGWIRYEMITARKKSRVGGTR